MKNESKISYSCFWISTVHPLSPRLSVVVATVVCVPGAVVVIGFGVEGGGGGTVAGGGRGHRPGNRKVNQGGSGLGQRWPPYSNKPNEILKPVLT